MLVLTVTPARPHPPSPCLLPLAEYKKQIDAEKRARFKAKKEQEVGVGVGGRWWVWVGAPGGDPKPALAWRVCGGAPVPDHACCPKP